MFIVVQCNANRLKLLARRSPHSNEQGWVTVRGLLEFLLRTLGQSVNSLFTVFNVTLKVSYHFRLGYEMVAITNEPCVAELKPWSVRRN